MTMAGEREGRKICLIDDPNEYARFAAAPTVTCGMCGAKAHDASLVCEPGVHSDVT